VLAADLGVENLDSETVDAQINGELFPSTG
jgi:hypothetical protein